jgi:hypothetical protein
LGWYLLLQLFAIGRQKFFGRVMTKERLRNFHPRLVRCALNEAIEKADEIHILEKELVLILKEIDTKRFYARAGQKSLRGFCNKVLQFSETQSQRLTTIVRRSEPTPNIGIQEYSDPDPS